ncbi:hypothetical protein AB0395_25665 [Streptosporangium sp. NPDC051023]|uniref:hypothetical protein n=1 Tax=Streptosporangium sp. NPDC051023 TaxID=3155410 RepID=UPI00344EC391
MFPPGTPATTAIRKATAAAYDPAATALRRLQQLLLNHDVFTTLGYDEGAPRLTVVQADVTIWTDHHERTFFWNVTGERAEQASVSEAGDAARRIAERLTELAADPADPAPESAL